MAFQKTSDLPSNLTTWVFLLCIAASPTTATENKRLPDNAALQYWQAFAVSPDVSLKAIWNASSDDREFGLSAKIGEKQARYVREGEHALRLLHRGADIQHCDWGVDLTKDGPLTLVRHGEKARGLAALAILRARHRFEHGDWDRGVDDIIATMTMGRHIGRDHVPYNVNYGCMIENTCVSTAAAYLQKMPAEVLVRFAERLDGLPAFTPMQRNIADWEQTIDWADLAFSRAEEEGRLEKLLSEILSADEARSLLAHAGDAKGLKQLNKAARLVLRECAEIAKLSPQEYERLFEAQIKPSFDRNPMAAFFVSGFDTARGEEATAHCRLEFLRAGIGIVTRGESALSDYPDPYGNGPFGFERIPGGFLLKSKLYYFTPICLEFRSHQDNEPQDRPQRTRAHVRQ